MEKLNTATNVELQLVFSGEFWSILNNKTLNIVATIFLVVL